MLVGIMSALGNKNKQVAHKELNSLIRIKCYKQAAPLGLEEKQTTLQLQG
ncbi:MAG TPA: hypothetical protein VJ440_12065 [Candidatus Brocadiaceae bacterium]|nr:hypothetical protein [Candidatus Brocadiaceae bacterium]